jgi:hypothetical protein
LDFLVTDKLAFTCAHVVSGALRTSRDAGATGESVKVESAFRYGEGVIAEAVEATVGHWSATARPCLGGVKQR